MPSLSCNIHGNSAGVGGLSGPRSRARAAPKGRGRQVANARCALLRFLVLAPKAHRPRPATQARA
eukprot:5423926-Alexandrium_andersonii.AAC.1